MRFFVEFILSKVEGLRMTVLKSFSIKQAERKEKKQLEREKWGISPFSAGRAKSGIARCPGSDVRQQALTTPARPNL